MGTNLIINNKKLILDLPESFEIDYNAFKGEQRIHTLPALNAKWTIQSDTVDVSLDTQGRFLKYSILSNISDDIIEHIVLYTDNINNVTHSLTILQNTIKKLYSPYNRFGFYKTKDHYVYEIEFVKVNAFDTQIILDHSDITFSNSKFSTHSIVQKESPIVRVQVPRSYLSEPREATVTLTINQVLYTVDLVTKIDPLSLVRNLTPHIIVEGNKTYRKSFNSEVEYDGVINYKCSSPLLYPRQSNNLLDLRVTSNWAFESKFIVVDAYVDGTKIQDIGVEIKSGVIVKDVSKVLNSIMVSVVVPEDTLITIRDCEYELDNKVHQITIADYQSEGRGDAVDFEGIIQSGSTLTNGGYVKFTLKIGNESKRYTIKIN